MAQIKPMKFFLPGIFLLALGVGNLLVGIFKGSQYADVLSELSATRPTNTSVSTSPLRRIQLAEKSAERLYLRLKKAKARVGFYQLVAFGGKVLVGLSLPLLIVSSFLQLRLSYDRRHEGG